MPKKISATQPGSILSSQWETVAFLTCPSPPQPLCRFRWSLLDDGSRPTLRGGTGAHLPPSRSSRRKRSQKRSQKMKSSSWRSTPCSGHLTQKTGRYQTKTENNFTQKKWFCFRFRAECDAGDAQHTSYFSYQPEFWISSGFMMSYSMLIAVDSSFSFSPKSSSCRLVSQLWQLWLKKLVLNC